MAFTTVYDVKVRYSVDNRAGQAVGGMVRDTRQLGREVRSTTGAFQRLGTMVAGVFGARMAYRALISFNSQVEDTKNQIAGMLALSKKTDLSAEIGNSERLFRTLQKRAASLPGTTKEYVQMAGALTQPIIDAGLSMKDLEDITVNAVVGAKALGYEWGLAARDIDQALRGQFHATDPFAGKILGSIGYKGEEGRSRYNALSAADRASEMARGMKQKQLTQLANAQGQTFSGALSTLQDTIEQFVGKVGLPLFQAITKELKGWNKWIDQNKFKMDEIAATLGHGLVTGFEAVKSALTFVAQHADTLIAIGKVWAAVKIGGMVGGALASGGNGVASKADALFGAGGWFRGASDRFNPETGGYEHTAAGAGRSKVGLKGAADNANLLAGAFAGGYAIGNALGLDKVGSALGTKLALLTGRTDKTSMAFERLQQTQEEYDRVVRRSIAEHNGPQIVGSRLGVQRSFQEQASLARVALESEAKIKAGKGMPGSETFKRYAEVMGELEKYQDDIASAGGLAGFRDRMQAKASAMGDQTMAGGAIGVIALQGLTTQLTDYQKRTLDEAKAQQELLVYIHQTLKSGKVVDPVAMLDILRSATMDPSGKHKDIADKPKVNIHIARIEVQSDDPDRMAFGLIESFREAAKNPSSALDTFREG